MVNKKEKVLVDRKEKILSRLTVRNYNNELEQILVDKGFDERVENTLLNIVYKIETSYADYTNVKRKVVSKEELIDTYFNVIKNECEQIIVIKDIPEDVRSYYKNIKISKDNKKVKTYLNEKAMLYSLLLMNKIDVKLNSDKNFVADSFNKFLRIGFANNSLEVLRDFNGWSWELSKKEVQNNYYNILFQNLIYMLDDKYILDVCLKKDFENTNDNNDVIDNLQYKLESKYGSEFAEKYMKLMLKILVQLYIGQSTKEKDFLLEEYKKQKQTLNEIRKKRNDLEKITADKKKMLAQIKKIDTILASKVALKEEYNRINKKLISSGKEKISVRKLISQLKTKREDILEKIELYNKIISPKEYIKEVELHENIIEFMDGLDVLNKNQTVQELRVEIKNNFISLEKMYLEKLNESINDIDSKKVMLEKVYEFRYYNLLPVNTKDSLCVYKECEVLVQKIRETFITKMVNEKWLISVTSDRNKNVNNQQVLNVLNFQILEYIFNNNVVKIENLIVEAIKNKKGNLQINYYDGEVFCISKEFENINFSTLNVRLGKKTKMF